MIADCEHDFIPATDWYNPLGEVDSTILKRRLECTKCGLASAETKDISS